jgi:membrane protein YdbS with pleckstrin-like domain
LPHRRGASILKVMTPLHRRHLTLLRLRFAIGGAVAAVAVAALEFTLRDLGWLPDWTAAGAGAVLILIMVLVMPGRRYRAWGYAEGEDELSVKHGLMVRKLSVVPFGRVQHIDIAQGPLERSLGLATLVLNTAGTRGAAVRLPGLERAEAERMRDHIRHKIRLDLS